MPWVKQEAMRQISDKIVNPILQKLASGNRRFAGLLYPGLKITHEGPKVLEFNARFGDPETQVLLRLLKTDLLDILEACVYGTLEDITIEWHPGFAACVVMASKGYPGTYETGFPISGLEATKEIPGVEVFHAGTVFDNGCFKTSGGRVLGVSAIGDTLQKALDNAYEAVCLINFPGAHYRRDIGQNALARELQNS